MSSKSTTQSPAVLKKADGAQKVGYGTKTVAEDLDDKATDLGVIHSPEVIDLNYPDIYRLESDYDFSGGTVWGFAHTGQSLAEGGVGGDSVAGITPPVYPDKAFMLFNAPVGLAAANLGNSLVSLQEPGRVTIATSFTRKTILDQVPAFQAVFHGQAWGGKAYTDIKKGGATGTFEKIITQANNAFDLRTNMIYKGVTCIHGEQDGLNGNTNYAANLLEWQTDFNTDLKAVTGQVADIPLFLCQTATAGGYNHNGGITETTFPTPLEQLEAHVNNANIVMVCSKYHLPYYDHSHITNNAQRILGEYYQKAFAEVQDAGSYDPLRPATVVGSGNTVTVTFAGRVGNLVFDTSLVQSISNMGFDYVDDSGNTITNVVISSNQVIVTLSGTIGANPFLSYAYHNGAGGATNQVAGLGDRGNLRDSDPAVSLYDGARLYNWCVIFKEAVS